LIKFNGKKEFYVADPWIVYQAHPEWEKLKLDVDECIIKVELEAINFGKKKVSYFILGTKEKEWRI